MYCSGQRHESGGYLDTLMPFQDKGADWLADRNIAYLGDEMGLGKTAQLITAADRVGARRVWTNCPAMGRINWQREFDMWSTFVPEFRAQSYDKVTLDKRVRAEIKAFKPDVMILDEAQYLGNRVSKRTMAMLGAYCHNTGVLEEVPHVWFASGTPWLGNITELWPVLRSHFPHLIPGEQGPMGFMEFMAKYTNFTVDDYGFKVLGNKPDMVPELKQLLERFMLRRTGRTVLPEMPPIFWGDYVIEADTIPRELQELDGHAEIEKLRLVLDAAVRDETPGLYLDEDPIAIATMRRLTSLVKAPLVAGLIHDELMSGEYDKILLFAWHKEAIDVMGEILAPFDPVFIRGGQTDKRRQEQIDRFQNEARARVALVQIAAGYHTITLHAAAQVGFVEKDWRPDINVQAAKRAHRKGQLRPVRVRSFGLANSIDEAVNKVLTRKAKAILELRD